MIKSSYYSIYLIMFISLLTYSQNCSATTNLVKPINAIKNFILSDGSDKPLKITGDGSVMEMKQLNVTNDGKTFQLVDTYVEVNPFDIQRGVLTKEDLCPPSAKVDKYGAILPSTEDDEPKLYRLRDEVFFIFDITGSAMNLIRGPIPISQSDENFPDGITSAVGIGNDYYLFFKNGKFCRRKLNIPKDKGPCSDGFKDNYLLFGCKDAELKSHIELCKDVNIDGAAYFDECLFVFRGPKYWIFTNSSSSHPGYFSKSGFVTSKTFNGFVQSNDGITSIGKGKSAKFLMINNGKWFMWSNSGYLKVNGSKIEETIVTPSEEHKAIQETKNKSPIVETVEIDESSSSPVNKLIDTSSSSPVDEAMDLSSRSNEPVFNNISYPSSKDGMYGAIFQLDQTESSKFARLRGKEVYYFTKKGDTFEFSDEMVPIRKHKQLLPPDINVVFRGPDLLFYFIREENYCRRPLDVSKVGLDPPDYCPEGGDLRELLGCNVRFYPPNIDELCHSPAIDNAFVIENGNKVYLFRRQNYWILNGLPTKPAYNPSKSYLTEGGDATKKWNGFRIDSDATFTLVSGPDTARLVQFKNQKFKIWDANGGQPIEEGNVAESSIKKKISTEPVFVEVTHQSTSATTEPILTNTIIYDNVFFRDLCLDPTIDAADSNLNGSLVYLYKSDTYFILTGLREGEIGKLTKSGYSNNILPKFQSDVKAVMTCKEGYKRGWTLENTAKNYLSSWDLQSRLVSSENFKSMAYDGLDAVLHNRNVSDPVMIGLKDDNVFYYTTASEKFAQKRRQVKHFDSPERFPFKIDAAFSMPNGLIYLFRGKEYCVREWHYQRFCPKWRDSRELFGCFGGESKRVKNSLEANKSDVDAHNDLCTDLNINDADTLWQNENNIYVWRGVRFWQIADFPHSPRVVEAGVSSDKWRGFSENPDAVVILRESLKRRGWLYAMYGGHWSSWYPDNKPWVGYKSWWGQPIDSKFGAMMHNGDIVEPEVLGFEGKFVHYYNTDGTQLRHKRSKPLSATAEVWPLNLTAAFRMDDDTVFLFRGTKYCKRKWKCSNSSTKCCEWKEAEELFGCKGAVVSNKE